MIYMIGRLHFRLLALYPIICLALFPSACLAWYPSAFLSAFCLPFCLPSFLPTYIPARFACLPVCLPPCPSAWPPFCLPARLSALLPAHPSACLSALLPAYLSNRGAGIIDVHMYSPHLGWFWWGWAWVPFPHRGCRMFWGWYHALQLCRSTWVLTMWSALVTNSTMCATGQNMNKPFYYYFNFRFHLLFLNIFKQNLPHLQSDLTFSGHFCDICVHVLDKTYFSPLTIITFYILQCIINICYTFLKQLLTYVSSWII